MDWTKKEQELLEKYFTSNITELALYKSLYKINPRRSYEAMTRRLRDMKSKGWIKDSQKSLSQLRIGYLDIEATQLKANFGYMISWYIKKRDHNEYDYSVITKDEIFRYDFDKRLVLELLTAFKKYDILYTHYGADGRFDIPFIRTRAYDFNLQHLLPPYMDIFLMDTWPIARNKLALHSNRLDVIARAVGITHVKKTPLNERTWRLASVGHKDSIDYIVDHNKKDVQLLEQVHKKLECVERPIYRSI